MHEQFGRYILLERIAIGGMAEIFKAKAPGLGGFEKILAIKRLHPRYSQDADFIDMLIDEARITVQLNHSNIGQIFDLSKVDEDYFIAMEFIDGRDLYRVQKRLRDTKQRMPLDAAAFIAMEACSGLDHAHRKRDNRNRPLRIVHRDVSPQNILASFEGDVKVVDFGIAKAQFRAYETEAGIIKGKFYYMSPEQARGESVDHRTDIFSLGIVLYEMVTGELLYKDDDDVTLLSRVRRAEIEPPRRFRPDLPDDFERIIMKALARDKEDRYPSAQHMQRDLAKFLRRSHSTFNKSRLGALMQQTFAEEFEIVDGESLDSLRERSDFMEDEGSLISEIQFLDEPELTEQSGGYGADELMELPSDEFLLVEEASEELPNLRLPPLASTPKGNFKPKREMPSHEEDDFLDSAPTQAFDNEPSQDFLDPVPDNRAPARNLYEPQARSVKGKSTVPIEASESRGEESAMVRRLRLNQESSREARFEHNATAMLSEDEMLPEQQVSMREPARRSWRADDKPRMGSPSTVEQTGLSAEKLKAWFGVGLGVALIVVLSFIVTSLLISDKTESSSMSKTGGQDQPAATSGVKNKPGKAVATLEIKSTPSGARVQIDGRWAFEATPTEIEVPAGRTVRVRIQQERYKREERELQLQPGEVKQLMVPLKRLYGTLKVESSPKGAVVYVDGNALGRTPQTLSKLPLEVPTPLRLVKAGFEDYEALIKWPADDSKLTQTHKVQLEPRRSDPPPKRKRTIRKKRKKKKRPPSRRRREPATRQAPAENGFIKVIVKPWGQVFIDGRLVSEEGRLFNHPLSAGRHEVWACIRGNRRECTPRRTVYIQGGKSELLRFP